jgi:hypothetical protein
MLRKGQSAVVNYILNTYNSGTKTAQLTGDPGTGKTFTTGEVVRVFSKMGMRIAVVASDNNALNVVKDAARRGGWRQRVMYWGTAHQILGIVVDDDGNQEDTGKSKCHKFDVVFVDEASKLGSAIVYALEQRCRFIVYVGDRRQLLPVGEDFTPAFSSDSPELTENVRQSGNEGLIRLVSYTKSAIDDETFGIPAILLKPFRVDDWMEWESFLGNEYVAICFTNAEAERLNRIARKNIGCDDQFVVGDKIIFKKTVYEKNADGTTEKLFLASEIGIVESCSRYFDDRQFPLWSLRIRTKEKVGYISVYDTSDDNIGWIKFLIESGVKSPKIADIGYGYAITVHRAQGSEYPKVMVNMRDFRRGRNINDRRRMCYVAFSRATVDLKVLV